MILMETETQEYYENTGKNLKDYLATVWRRKFQIVIISTLLILLAIAFSLGLSSVFRSSSTILIEQQEIPQDLVRTTITSYADQRIQVISQRVMTSANLWKVIQKYDLYKEMREKKPRELVIKAMRDDISLDTLSAEVVDPRSGKPVQATIAFTLAYDSESPSLAQKVANELTSLFLKENVKSRTQMASDTLNFLQEEGRKLEQKIKFLEKNLAEFKEKNVNKLPELTQLNTQLMDRTERELYDVERDIRLLKERKIYLTSELSQLNPSSSILSEQGERVLSPAGRLKMIQAEYLRLSAVYSSEHPDILRMEKEIKGLEDEVGVTDSSDHIKDQLVDLNNKLLEAQEQYSKNHPTVMRLRSVINELEIAYNEQQKNKKSNPSVYKADLEADNPAYIQLKTQLQAAESELLSQNKSAENLRDKLKLLENRLIETPQVERTYNELTRDYENAAMEYREIKAKQMDAQLAESMEIGRKGERFTLIEPPLLPEQPIKPNRIAILVLGVFASMVIGLGSAFLMDTIDGNLHGRKAVFNLLGEYPLSSIPYIMTDAEVVRRSMLVKIGVVSVGAFLLLAMLVFHLLIMPLDTFGYVMMRRLGV